LIAAQRVADEADEFRIDHAFTTSACTAGSTTSSAEMPRVAAAIHDVRLGHEVAVRRQTG
jgi:hypothetical protein